jgi:hypothetical protein
VLLNDDLGEVKPSKPLRVALEEIERWFAATLSRVHSPLLLSLSS